MLSFRFFDLVTCGNATYGVSHQLHWALNLRVQACKKEDWDGSKFVFAQVDEKHLTLSLKLLSKERPFFRSLHFQIEFTLFKRLDASFLLQLYSIQQHSNSIFLQLDRRIIDNFEGWKYVRSKVITFVPAKARACSLDELQSPPDGSGLMLNSTDAIEFNQFAVFNCPDDQVTDDGPLFKIKCLPNGQYQSRKWKACRERKVCEIRPPKPPTKYGLARDNTRGIKEFENATYACKDPNMVQ